jgi:MFS family permease
LLPSISNARAVRGETSRFLGLTPSGKQPHSWVTLRNPNFRLYFSGSVTSDFGTWVQNTAQVLLAYKLAHSAFDVGLVTCAQFTSPLVLGPWAGVMADRFGGRKTLLGTQVLSAMIAFSMAGLELAHVLNEWLLVAGALAGGFAFTFALPARNVTVRRLVSADEARPAYVMDAVSYNIGRAVGPPVTVLLLAPNHFGLAFAANGVSFIVFTVTLLLARHGEAEPGVRSRVRDGFVIALHNRMILLLLLMVAAVTIADDPILVLGPTLAHHLGGSPSWAGWFIAALGAGSVLGSARRSQHTPRLRLAATALAVLGVCMVVFVATPFIWVSLAAALAAGVTCLVANSMTRTLLSQTAGKAQMAPVMAVWAIAWAGSKPIASLTDGSLAGLVGYRATGIILAVPAMLPLAYLVARSRLKRKRPTTKSAHRERPHRADASHVWLTPHQPFNWTDDNKARGIHNQVRRNGGPIRRRSHLVPATQSRAAENAVTRR